MENHPKTLAEWLERLEMMHPKAIDMGLDRVRQVKDAMDVQFSCPVIIVGGTNGKGSTCAMLESVLLQAGYRVGLYTSPHLLHFNERMRISGKSASDEQLIAAFDKLDVVRGDVSLSYFEFTTLAAIQLFADVRLDAVIFEVGLGGRLDAVNVLDADVSIITSIDIDHTEYLGDTREKIGFEKAGIFRSEKSAICGDPVPPASLIEYAEKIGADLWLFNRDFNYSGDKQQWNFSGRGRRRNALAYPSLRGANQLLNASSVLAALEVLRMRLPVSAQEVRTGLAVVDLPGRFQVLPGRPTIILDVAHNPHAAATLAQNLDNMGFYPYTYAVFGAMEDKDIDGVIAQMKGRIDHWCIAELPLPRAAKAASIREKLLHAYSDAPAVAESERSIQTFATPADAFINARSRAGENDRITVFGSFLTVAGVMELRHFEHH